MEKKNCPCKGLWRALIIIAAVIGAFVAVEAVLERVFKKYLKITVELEDIDDLDDGDECCCCDDDDDCCCCDEEEDEEESDDCCCGDADEEDEEESEQSDNENEEQ